MNSEEEEEKMRQSEDMKQIASKSGKEEDKM